MSFIISRENEHTHGASEARRQDGTLRDFLVLSQFSGNQHFQLCPSREKRFGDGAFKVRYLDGTLHNFSLLNYIIVNRRFLLTIW